MAHERVGDMTCQELMQLFDAAVNQRIQSDGPKPYRQQSDRPISEVIESIKRNVIISKLGTPSVVDMIREDRDR